MSNRESPPPSSSPPASTPLIETCRVDKWLWCIRLAPTRHQATETCRRGHVKIAGQAVKPSRLLRAGDEVLIEKENITLRVRVLAAPPTRVGAKLAADFYQDLTPIEAYEKEAQLRQEARLNRIPHMAGAARSDKKQLRELRLWMEQEGELRQEA